MQETKGLNRNRRDEPVVDPALTLLKVTDAAGHSFAAIVNFAAHPTLYSDNMMAVSADWPGVMASELEKAMGNGSVCLFLNGAEGDAAPKEAEGMAADARVQDYGHRVGQAVLALLNSITTRPGPALVAWTQAITLPPRKANGMFLLAAATYGADIPQARQLVDGLMPKATAFHFIRIGDLLLMGCPCNGWRRARQMKKRAGRKNLGSRKVRRAAGVSRPRGALS